MNYKRDYEGWIEAKCSTRDEYRMMEVMTENGKVLQGWWTGYTWDGLHITRNTKVKKWRFYNSP